MKQLVTEHYSRHASSLFRKFIIHRMYPHLHFASVNETSASHVISEAPLVMSEYMNEQ